MKSSRGVVGWLWLGENALNLLISDWAAEAFYGTADVQTHTPTVPYRTYSQRKGIIASKGFS